LAAGVVAETGELSTAAGSDFGGGCVLSRCTCGNSPGWCLSQEQITTTAVQTLRLFPNDNPIGGGTVMAFLPSVQGGKWEWQAANAERRMRSHVEGIAGIPSTFVILASSLRAFQ